MADYTSSQSGNWSSSSTWGDAGVPGDGDTAYITGGYTVTLDSSVTVGDDNVSTGYAIKIDGQSTLYVPHNISSNVTLTVKGNITPGSFGSELYFDVGDSSNSLDSTKTFTIILNYDVPGSSTQRWRLYGASKTSNTTLTAGVTAGSNPTISVSNADGWKANDKLILLDETDYTKIEELSIDGTYTSGTSVLLSGTLSNNKSSGALVLNMTRNIIIKSTTDKYFGSMGRASYECVFENVMLDGLGDGSPDGFILSEELDSRPSKISCYNVKTVRTHGSQINHGEIIFYATNSNNAVYHGNDDKIDTLIVAKTTGSGSGFVAASNGSCHFIGTAKYYGCSSVLNTSGGNITINELHCYCSSGNALASSGDNVFIGDATIKYSGGWGVTKSVQANFRSLTASNNTSGDIEANGNIIQNSDLSSSTTIGNLASHINPIYISNFQNTVGHFRMYKGTNIVESDSSVYRTSASSIKVTCTYTQRDVLPISGLMPTLYVNNSKTVSLKLRVRKDVGSSTQQFYIELNKASEGHGLSTTNEYDINPKCPATVTISFTNGTDKVNGTSHGLSNNDIVSFTTTGAMPTGLSASTDYYVVNANTNDFQLSLTQGGAAIDFTSDGSGTFTIWQTFTHSLGTTTSAGFVTLELFLIRGSATSTYWIDDIELIET